MKIFNLTPHELNIYKADGDVLIVPRTGRVARVHEVREPIGMIDGIAIETSYPGKIEGLPPPAPETIYIVSAMVARETDRPDVYSPGQLLRDERGQPMGCRGLTRRGFDD
jgi:hypothetical protein